MPSDPMYSSARWRKLRLQLIEQQPVCTSCNKLPTTVVDHLVPWKSGTNAAEVEALKWGVDNLSGKCKVCHDYKTATKDNGKAFGRWKRMPDYIDPPRMPVTLVCGANGSGVTEYIQANAEPDDLIIDPVLIASKLSGEGLYRADMEQWLVPTMLERNRLLSTLSKVRNPKAWVAITGAKAIDRRQWKELLNAEVIVLETSLYTCEEAIRHSPRYNKKKDLKAARDWWKQYCSDPSDKVIIKS